MLSTRSDIEAIAVVWIHCRADTDGCFSLHQDAISFTRQSSEQNASRKKRNSDQTNRTSSRDSSGSFPQPVSIMTFSSFDINLQWPEITDRMLISISTIRSDLSIPLRDVEPQHLSFDILEGIVMERFRLRTTKSIGFATCISNHVFTCFHQQEFVPMVAAWLRCPTALSHHGAMVLHAIKVDNRPQVQRLPPIPAALQLPSHFSVRTSPSSPLESIQPEATNKRKREKSQPSQVEDRSINAPQIGDLHEDILEQPPAKRPRQGKKPSDVPVDQVDDRDTITEMQNVPDKPNYEDDDLFNDNDQDVGSQLLSFEDQSKEQSQLLGSEDESEEQSQISSEASSDFDDENDSDYNSPSEAEREASRSKSKTPPRVAITSNVEEEAQIVPDTTVANSAPLTSLPRDKAKEKVQFQPFTESYPDEWREEFLKECDELLPPDIAAELDAEPLTWPYSEKPSLAKFAAAFGGDEEDFNLHTMINDKRQIENFQPDVYRAMSEMFTFDNEFLEAAKESDVSIYIPGFRPTFSIHQAYFITWGLLSENFNFGGVLGDEMDFGQTRGMICFRTVFADIQLLQHEVAVDRINQREARECGLE